MYPELCNRVQCRWFASPNLSIILTGFTNLDGFRALAKIDGHRCQLISRRGHRFNQWDLLCEELAHAVRCDSATLDGEIVCLDDDGRPNFHKPLFRRDWPFFYAFDLIELDGLGVRQMQTDANRRERRFRKTSRRQDG